MVVRVLDRDDVARVAGGEVHVKGAYLAGAGIPVGIASTARLAGQHGAGRDVPLGEW